MITNITNLAPGKLSITGSLNFNNAAEIYRQALHHLEQKCEELIVDLTAVQQSDSAGLAFLVTWFKEAEKKNKKLYFVNPPEHLLAIARVSSVEQLFDTSE